MDIGNKVKLKDSTILTIDGKLDDDIFFSKLADNKTFYFTSLYVEEVLNQEANPLDKTEKT